MTLRRTVVLSAVALAICASLDGCSQRRTGRIFGDMLWANDELRVIIQTQYYVAPALTFHGSGEMAKQEWELFTVPFSNHPNPSIKKHKFLSKAGGYEDSFSAIAGSDLFVHEVELDLSDEHQFRLFDPKTGTDISPPFPSTPSKSRLLLNRSRTACLLWEGKQAVIVDVLSAKTGAPKILSCPPWAGIWKSVRKGKHRPVLTQDAQGVILFPDTSSADPVIAGNFTAEIWSIDGAVQRWTLPIERKEGRFVDAESIDGNVILLWRNLLSNGSEDGVELVSTQGETLHSGKVSAFNHGLVWNLERQEILVPCYEGPGTVAELPRTYYVWNYYSDTVRRVGIKQ